MGTRWYEGFAGSPDSPVSLGVSENKIAAAEKCGRDPLSAAQIYKDHCQAQEDLDKGQQRLISRIRQSNGPRETDYLVSLNHFTPAPKCWVTVISLVQRNGVLNKGCGMLCQSPREEWSVGEWTSLGGLNLKLQCWHGKSKLCKSALGNNNNNYQSVCAVESMSVVESMGKHSILTFRKPNLLNSNHPFQLLKQLFFLLVFQLIFCFG